MKRVVEKLFVHFTTVHRRGDTRIRVKEVATLAKYRERSASLYVQDGKGHEKEADGTAIVDTAPAETTRVVRMTRGSWRMYRAVQKARPTVAHFHDPELIPVGLLLKLSGTKVVYDVHEDLPHQILSKPWIPRPLRYPVAWAASGLEAVAARIFDRIVPATPTIARRFPAGKTVTVQNFPILSELVAPDPVPYADRPPHFAYVGAISAIRGAREMVAAVRQLGSAQARLRLAGQFQPSTLQAELGDTPGWARVNFQGWAGRSEVAALLGQVRAGLVVLHPTQNYPDAYPVKMFEYMAAGLPVIASDFRLWRAIVEGARCGLLVDPQNPDAIAAAMQWILDHTEEAEAMGRRGREAVERTYNWEAESEKLIAMYRGLLDCPDAWVLDEEGS